MLAVRAGVNALLSFPIDAERTCRTGHAFRFVFGGSSPTETLQKLTIWTRRFAGFYLVVLAEVARWTWITDRRVRD
jgi:hypothetical protein